MYKAIIIEDEKPAAEHLQRLINQVDIKIDIISIISSVDEALVWFNNNPLPDLIFLDIQLILKEITKHHWLLGDS